MDIPSFPEIPRMRQVLDGDWEIRPVEAFAETYPPEGWLTVQVPHHWQMVPGLETYSGKVVYRKRFSSDPEPGCRYHLRLNGIFYRATAHLNGRRLGHNEGYFYPVEYDVTPCLQRENLLVVEVDCPDEAEKINKQLITGVFSHWDAMDPTLNPGGIWQPVELVRLYPAFIVETFVHTLDFDEHYADIQVRTTIQGSTIQQVQWRLVFLPDNFEGAPQEFLRPLELKTGCLEFVADLRLPDYRLWWTHDRGFPHLYRLQQDLLAPSGRLLDRVEERIGIRLFEFKDYRARLNKRPIFIKGNNYGPTDARLATTTRARVEHDLELARQAHMNMLRVHAHVGHPALYEVADEQGILLWQDFPLQWHYRNEVEPEAVRQVQQMVKLLYNHPSVVKWCVHNEPFSVVRFDETSLRRNAEMLYNIFLFSRNDAILDRRLRDAVQRVDTTRYASANSGMFGWLWRGTDSHFYFGWYPIYGPIEVFQWVSEYIQRSLRFASEFGAQSFPNYESAVRFMSADIQKLDWKRLTEKHGLQLALMRHWLPIDSYPDLAGLIQATQDYQSHLNRFYIDRLRLHKYNPTGGILAFMFHDPSPGVLWSVIDYWRVPKSSYYALQKAFRPLYVFALLHRSVYREGEILAIPIYLVNDASQGHDEVQVTIVLEEEGGRILQKKYLTTEAGPDCLPRQVETLNFLAAKPGQYTVGLYLEAGDGIFTNEYRFRVEAHPQAKEPGVLFKALLRLEKIRRWLPLPGKSRGSDLLQGPPHQAGRDPDDPKKELQ